MANTKSPAPPQKRGHETLRSGARSAAPSERCLARHAHHAPFRLRELARRPTACSLEHRARARFDEEHLLAVGELESATAADGHQTRHRLGQTATRSRYGIAAWHWPRRSTACRARRSSGGPVPAAPMADTAIWSTLSWPLANVVSARALIYDLVGIVPAFGPCFACSCDQKVRARLLASSHRYFYKVLYRGA